MRVRSPRNRTPGFDVAFALSFTSFLVGVVVLVIGTLTVSGPLLGFGFVVIPCSLAGCVGFGVKGAVVQQRSIIRSLVNGYRQLLGRPR